VLAEVIRDQVLSRPELRGVYHIAGPTISKFDLLQLIAKRYEKQIEFDVNDTPVSNRSLDASRFFAVTGYVAPDWSRLVDSMYIYHRSIARI